MGEALHGHILVAIDVLQRAEAEPLRRHRQFGVLIEYLGKLGLELELGVDRLEQVPDDPVRRGLIRMRVL